MSKQAHTDLFTIQTTFAQFKSWEDRYRYIMKAGKNLADYPTDKLTDNNLVDGCESQVWLTIKQIDQQLYFYATSDARIVKGLLWLMLAPINGLTAKEIIEFDVEKHFDQLDLIKHLSPSRGNGLITISKQVIKIATDSL